MLPLGKINATLYYSRRSSLQMYLTRLLSSLKDRSERLVFPIPIPAGMAKCSQTQYRAVTFDQSDRDSSGLFFCIFILHLLLQMALYGKSFHLFSGCQVGSETPQEHLKQTF